MFIGKVNIFIIGLINILKRVKHAPTIRAVVKTGFKLIPDTIYVVANTATESIIQCKIIFMFDFCSKLPSFESADSHVA